MIADIQPNRCVNGQEWFCLDLPCTKYSVGKQNTIGSTTVKRPPHIQPRILAKNYAVGID